jgi:hypothetical protein
VASHPYGQQSAHAGNVDPGLFPELSGRGKANEVGNLKKITDVISWGQQL